MEAPSESVDCTGIFPCKVGTNFSCSICPADSIFQNWQKHIEGPRHSGTLQRFKLVFHKTSNGVACKVCGSELAWESLKTHANWHRIVPWYEPPDRYKTFFKNHMLEWESQFYCKICDVFFPEWSTAYIHISEKSHQDLVKKEPPVNDFVFFHETEVPYDIFVKEDFESTASSTTVECGVCFSPNIGVRNVVAHVRGQKHLSFKTEYLREIRKAKEAYDCSQSEQSAAIGRASNSRDIKNAAQSLPCIYVVQQSEDEFSCEICDVQLDSLASVHNHVKGAMHKTALTKYGCDNIWLREHDYVYHCTCCDCPVLGIKNVHQHVRGFRHENSLSGMKNYSLGNQEARTNNNIAVEDKPSPSEIAASCDSLYLSDKQLEKLNSRETLCRLCNVVIKGSFNVQSHLKGKNHLSNEQHLSEYILLIEGNDYYCQCCDCMILGVENVYGHINGNRHAKSVEDFEEQETEASNKNSVNYEIPKQADNPSKKSNDASLPNDHIEALNSSESLCKLCNVVIKGFPNVQSHLTGKNHSSNEQHLSEYILLKEGNNYHCKCCDCMIPGFENVYGHINGNRHAQSLDDLENQETEASNKNSVNYEIPKQPDNPSQKFNDASLPNDHIETLNSNELLCKLCNVVIKGFPNVQSHLTGKNHSLGEQHLSQYILLKEGNNYHCKCCDCMIPGFENVYGHINGNRHAQSLDDLENQETEASNKNTVNYEISKQADNPSKKSNDASLPNDHIETLNSNELLCKLCNVVIKGFPNVQSHLTGKNHSSNEQHLSEYILLKEGNNYHCKCCDCMIPGFENVYGHINGNRHAKSLDDLENQETEASNKNSVNYEIPKQADNPFKKSNDASLPNDHIETLNSSELLCKLCNVVIKGFSNVQSHLTGKNHSWGEQHLSEYILLKEGNNYHCKCCDCMIPGFENVYGHINGNRHAQSLDDLGNKEAEASNKNSVNYEIPKQADDPKKPNDASLSNDHIEKLNSREFRCRLCDVVIKSVANVQGHLTGKNHLFGVRHLSEYILLKEGNNYHCKCCDCLVPGLENVYGHINGNRHAKSLNDFENQDQVASNKNSEVKIPKQPETATNSCFVPNGASLPNDHIEKWNSRESQCRLCNVTISGDSNVQEHLRDKRHVFAAKQFSKNISFKNGNNYHCRCCDCLIPGLENVYCHVKANRHATALQDFEMHEQEASNISVKVVIPKQPENIAKPRSTLNDVVFPKDHMENRNSGELYCRLCDEAVLGDSNIQEHLKKETHISNLEHLSKNISFEEGNFYHCKTCDCVMPGVENVYRHIKGVRHKRFMNDSQKHEKEPDCKNVVEAETPNQTKEISKPAGEKSSHDHIVELTNVTSCCKICAGGKFASSAVDVHLAGKRHAESLKRFSDEILMIKNDKYHCRLCNWTIYGIDNVYTHLQGNRHKSFVHTSDKPLLESSKISDSLAELHFEMNEEMELSERLSKPKSGIPKFDPSPRNIACSVCGVISESTSDFHSHLTTHVVADLALSEKSESINEIRDSLSKADQTNQNGTAESQLKTEIEGLELTEPEAKASCNGLRINGATKQTIDKDFVHLASPESVPVNCTTTEIKRRSPRKTSMQRIAQLLTFDNDYIHDMRDKFKEMELGMKLCLIKGPKNIYCLICRQEIAETAQNYYTHLSSADHCEYLEGMETDHALFELVPDQLSEFNLVFQYMEEISEDVIHCHACGKDLKNTNSILRDHINDKSHEQTCGKMHLKAKANFENMKPRLRCDWYDIHKYWCEPCSENFESELGFAKHLKSTGHAIVMRKSKNSERRLIYDFCSPCALLWFGFRSTYANHCQSSTHELGISKGHQESQDFRKIVENLLVTSQQYVDVTIKRLDELFVREAKKEETVIRDLEVAVKSKFPEAKAFPFGSRVSGLSTGDSDVEIFLDCGNRYDGKQTSAYEVLYLMTSVHQCLSKDLQSWDVGTLLTSCRSSILNARHKATGLTCEISFENGLEVENMKLIKYFIDIFPPCRKLILFLSQWLILCGLAGPQGISNQALYWCVIFYLQKESSLPSVASLIASKNNSHLIAGSEFGVSLDSTHKEAEGSNLSLNETLVYFFTFYAKFDYRYDIVCPLLGQEVKKLAFADPQCLPKEMAPYVDYIKNATDPRHFRIDSVMCIQDPLKLQRNFTETVSKACLSRFRKCCSKSLDVLCA